MFSPEESALLGLSTKENNVLASLGEAEWNVSNLAKVSKIGRTSLYPILKRLKRRGLALSTWHGKRKFWKTIPLPNLQEKLFSLSERHRANDQTLNKEVGIIASQGSQYKIYRGRERLLGLYEDLSKLPKATRLYGIQPNASLASAIKSVSVEQLMEMNEAIKRRHIVVEAILQEDFLKNYRDILEKTGLPTKNVLGSYGDRLAVTTYVPREYLNFNAEIIFYDNVLMILNWQELTAVIIKNKEIAGIMKELFELIKLTGKRVDQNPKVKEIVAESEQKQA